MKNIEARVSDHPFLRSLTPEHLEIATKNATDAEYEPDQILFREGEPANRFFLIESGRVAIEWRSPEGRTLRVQTLGAGEVVGWSWMFPPFCWHFQARAVEPTHMLVLDGAHLLVTAEDDPKFGYDLMRRISQILIDRLQASRKKGIESDRPAKE